MILSSAIIIIIFFTGSLNITAIIEAQKAIWFIVPLLPVFMIFFIGALAETNRAPMDLAEAESELVSGFMTEHAASIFVFFFLAEYASILLMSILTSTLFLGGYLYPYFEIPFISEILSWIWFEIRTMIWDQPEIISNINGHISNIMYSFKDVKENPIIIGLIYGLTFGIKTCIIVFTFIWVRASFPRIRYDQLMTFCWTVLLPILFAFIIVIPLILNSLNAIPANLALLIAPCLLKNKKNLKTFYYIT